MRSSALADHIRRAPELFWRSIYNNHWHYPYKVPSDLIIVFNGLEPFNLPISTALSIYSLALNHAVYYYKYIKSNGLLIAAFIFQLDQKRSLLLCNVRLIY